LWWCSHQVRTCRIFLHRCMRDISDAHIYSCSAILPMLTWKHLSIISSSLIFHWLSYYKRSPVIKTFVFGEISISSDLITPS
jgi:hypothetical protein